MVSYPCVALVFVAAFSGSLTCSHMGVARAIAASRGNSAAYKHMRVDYSAAQVQASTIKPDFRNTICKQENAYYAVDASCDSYVECIEFVPEEMLCPDGLHYNPEAKWPNYPCEYPIDVTCEGRGAAQPAQPTADCPHQYGFFASSLASDNCGQYRLCVAGQATEMVCPTGLAFNPDTDSCDWPDQVATCNVDQFLGFTCPTASTSATLVNYKHPSNCYYFFSCESGRARLLSCDEGLAFDPASGHCVDAQYVNCNVSPLAVTKPQ